MRPLRWTLFQNNWCPSEDKGRTQSHTKGRPWEDSERKQLPANQREKPQEKPTLPAPGISDFHPPGLSEINVCCWSHTVWVLFYGNPSKSRRMQWNCSMTLKISRKEKWRWVTVPVEFLGTKMHWCALWLLSSGQSCALEEARGQREGSEPQTAVIHLALKREPCVLQHVIGVESQYQHHPAWPRKQSRWPQKRAAGRGSFSTLLPSGKCPTGPYLMVPSLAKPGA